MKLETKMKYIYNIYKYMLYKAKNYILQNYSGLLTDDTMKIVTYNSVS
jgi:hypothetical protein